MMKKARKFDNILDECLERVLTGGDSVEQCLAAYPQYAVELEPLLRTALEVREASAISPRPEFRERAGYQFQVAIREMEAEKECGFFRQPGWATAVIAVVVLLLAGSGTVLAADSSLPGEPLYQVKLATETVQLWLTPSDLDKAELYVRLADERVAEIIEMADKGETEQVERTTRRLNEHLLAVTSLATPEEEAAALGMFATSEAEPTMPAVDEAPRLQVREAPTDTVVETAPVPAPASRPVTTPEPVEDVPLEDVEKAREAAPERAPALAVTESEEQRDSAGVEDDVQPDEQAELRRLLSQRAMENPEALRALLERVSESENPALRQAIEEAIAAYEEALSRLD